MSILIDDLLDYNFIMFKFENKKEHIHYDQDINSKGLIKLSDAFNVLIGKSKCYYYQKNDIKQSNIFKYSNARLIDDIITFENEHNSQAMYLYESSTIYVVAKPLELSGIVFKLKRFIDAIGILTGKLQAYHYFEDDVRHQYSMKV